MPLIGIQHTRGFMLGGGLIRQRVADNEIDFVEKLEQNLKSLPPEFQYKVKKLNFFSNAYDCCVDDIRKYNLKLGILELLEEFIQNGYHPIFVGIDLGYYIYSDQLGLQRLPVFKEIYDPKATHSPKDVLPAFSRLSAKANPFIPRTADTTPARANKVSRDLTISG